MARRLLTLCLGACFLATMVPTELEAARGRKRNRRKDLGGNSRRARRGGEALAQSYYESAVRMGKKGQYGQATQLMERAVEKNNSNEKYRYYLSLLLYKTGDFGEAASHLKRLERARSDRYRTKAGALMSRIDGVLNGSVPLVQPLRPSMPAGSGGHLEVLPPSAYVNVASRSAAMRSGAGGVKEMRGSVMTPADWAVRRANIQTGDASAARMEGEAMASSKPMKPSKPAMKADPMADQPFTPAEDPPAMAPPPAAAPAAPPPAVMADASDASAASDDFMDDPSDWASPEPAAPSKPAAPAKPAQPAAPAADAPSDDEFAEVFDDFGPEDGGDAPAAAPPDDNPFVEEPDPPAAADPAPAADSGFDEFDDGAFEDEPAEAPAAPSEPAEDEFEDFEEDFEEF